jgi:hypothetical protein
MYAVRCAYYIQAVHYKKLSPPLSLLEGVTHHTCTAHYYTTNACLAHAASFHAALVSSIKYCDTVIHTCVSMQAVMY